MSKQSEDPRRVRPAKVSPEELFPGMFHQNFEDVGEDASHGFSEEAILASGEKVLPASPHAQGYSSVFPEREEKLHHKYLNWSYNALDHHLVGAGLGAFHGFLALSGIPGVEKRHPLTKEGNFHVSLPMNVNIETEEIQLPLAVLDRLIDSAANHVILDKCMCRSGRHCKHHDPTIGCMFIGDTALDVIPGYSRQVSAEEAKQHARRGVADGLVPMACRTKIDNMAFWLRDRHTLLGICFCCDCCCYMAHFRSVSAEQLDIIYPRLKGLKITVDSQKCTGCGTCKSACFMDCIDVSSGIAVHGDRCRGCGRCETACPNGAVTLTLTDPMYDDFTVEKFLSIADLTEKRPQISQSGKGEK